MGIFRSPITLPRLIARPVNARHERQHEPEFVVRISEKCLEWNPKLCTVHHERRCGMTQAGIWYCTLPHKLTWRGQFPRNICRSNHLSWSLDLESTAQLDAVVNYKGFFFFQCESPVVSKHLRHHVLVTHFVCSIAEKIEYYQF